MATDVLLDLRRMPRLGVLYLRALTALTSRMSVGDRIPAITAQLDGLAVNRATLGKYNAICGFAHDIGTLPVTYPHVLAFPLQMAVLTHRAFPLRAPGLVHVGNRITQYRAIAVEEVLSLQVSVAGNRRVRRGLEFDLVTEILDAEATRVWTSTSTMLSRGSVGSPDSNPSARQSGIQIPESGDVELWDLPANIGRRYAAASRDMNPIHMRVLAARLFGFPRAIAHGMWLKARAVASLGPYLDHQRCAVDAVFNKPVFLPGQSRLVHKKAQDGINFALQG